MEEKLLTKIYELKKAISQDSRVLELDRAETDLNNSNEVAVLAMKKENALDEYNFALSHFKDNSNEVLIAQKNLYEAKKELDLHPLVVDYMKKYKVVRDLNKEIESIIFPINNKDKYFGGCK